MRSGAMTGKRCVVTGASRGLGLEFVRQMLARGDRVVAGCRTPAAADALSALAAAAPDRLHVHALDVADGAGRDAFAAAVGTHFDAVDLLVNNAGTMASGERFGAVAQATMEHAFRVNAAGPFLLAQALAPRLAAGRRPRVVSISSTMGSIAALSGFHAPSYSISKSALNMASALLAQALNPRGVGVLTLSPGWVRTDMGGASAPLSPADSVAGLLRVIDAHPGVPAGDYVDHDGTPLRW
jgi:NAD(P)-dependent dehydrogenase (short-subunit alcohol dehydrogenase family)